jgi:dTDP-4-dehydrorhamnose reductase
MVRTGSAPQFPITVTADLSIPEQAAAAVHDWAPDVILHCAALSSHLACEKDLELAFRVNSQATAEIALAAQECGSRLIYISTDSVFSGSSGHYSESDPTNPFSVYGRTKLQGEKLASRVTDPLIIRTNFFGWSPSHQRSILEFFYHNLASGNTVPGFTNVTTTSLYVRTLLDYIWQLSADNLTGVFHVTSADSLTKNKFGRLVAEVFGFDQAHVAVAESTEPRDISLATDKLAQALGHRPASQRDGLLAAQRDLEAS